MPRNTYLKLPSAMSPALIARVFLSVIVLFVAAAIGGCGPAITEPPGTPGWAVQSASAAARKRDYQTYVSFFTETYQRDEIKSFFFLLTIQVPIRAMAESEGPQSVAQVDAVLIKENKILKLLKIDWEWLAEISELSDEEEDKAIDDLVAGLKNPEQIWTEILKIEGEVPIWYGRIEKVTTDGDSATVKTYAENRDTFDALLALKRVDGNWKIDSGESAD
jgi:hypothetical protein